MNLLLNALAAWFAQNWFILLIIVLMIAMLVPSFLRQKKEIAAKNELFEKLTKGTKVITTAGIYGVVESIELTTDGKVVTIITGSKKNPSSMTVHINAIGGIDNKTPVVEDMSGNIISQDNIENNSSNSEAKEEVVDAATEDAEEESKPVEKSTSVAKTPRKKSAASKVSHKK
ncbi:MAG: preprotein translocase subunit YajC [Clostridiales bacterium]|nr:preprotein translocase subunit YajC [Clostridiales bacterium]